MGLWVSRSGLWTQQFSYLSSSYFWSSYNISIFLFHFNPREQLVISHKDHVANVCSSYKAWKRKQQMKKNFEPAFLSGEGEKTLADNSHKQKQLLKSWTKLAKKSL